MKILILANSDAGLYKFRRELLQRLLEKRNKVFLSTPPGEYIGKLKEMGCFYIETSLDRRGMNPIKDLGLLLQYSRLLRKIKPDAVLTYTIKPNLYGGIICQLHHVKYIENITGLGTAVENKSALSKLLLIWYRISLKKASQVFFQNEANRQFFETNHITGKSRLLPGSGVNLQEHRYEEYPQEEGEIRFLYVGRIMKDKGIEELLACARQLRKKYSHIFFDLVGGYDEEKYQREVEAMEKAGVVRYFGRQDDVHSYMKSRHAVILPSYHEGMSNVLLEAAACGRPILTTRVSGCQETFEEGVSGIGFEAKNVESLIAAVEKFLGLTYEEKREMGRRGREKMEKNFDRELVIKAYLQELYPSAQGEER